MRVNRMAAVMETAGINAVSGEPFECHAIAEEKSKLAREETKRLAAKIKGTLGRRQQILKETMASMQAIIDSDTLTSTAAQPASCARVARRLSTNFGELSTDNWVAVLH